MADPSSLPSSLNKLEIDAQSLLETEAESTLKSLTLLGDECPRVSCKCNTGTRSQPSWAWNARHFTILKSLSTCSSSSGKNGIVKKSTQRSSNQRSKSRILREPILKLTNCSLKDGALSSVLCSASPVGCDSKKCQVSSENKWRCASKESSRIFGQCSSTPQGDFNSLVPNSASLLSKDAKDFDAASYKHLRCNGTTLPSSSKVIKRKKELRKEGQLKTRPVPLADLNNSLLARSSSSQSTSCSQQARMVGPSHCDDVTIDELASYFDLFVHIPRKMSHMAENMYI